MSTQSFTFSNSTIVSSKTIINTEKLLFHALQTQVTQEPIVGEKTPKQIEKGKFYFRLHLKSTLQENNFKIFVANRSDGKRAIGNVCAREK